MPARPSAFGVANHQAEVTALVVFNGDITVQTDKGFGLLT
jgi:hypothetical protein